MGSPQNQTLVIQIPCLNESETIVTTLNDLPTKLDGISEIKVLIIDDGSTDDTVSKVSAWGVDKVVSHPNNLGLAKAFVTGLENSVAMGADIIVHTDADNQYFGADIENIVRPVQQGEADIVVGARPISEIPHFSPLKKMLQKFGSFVVRQLSKTDIPDAPSGFRAYSRDAAMKINIFSEYTYTLESIIQAGQSKMRIVSVPISVNEELRPSRLVKSISSYVVKSLITMLRVFVIYRPFRTFVLLGLILMTPGIILGGRYVYLVYTGEAGQHIQSLLLSVVFLIAGFQTALTGFLADLVSVNRKLIEKVKSLLADKLDG